MYELEVAVRAEGMSRLLSVVYQPHRSDQSRSRLASSKQILWSTVSFAWARHVQILSPASISDWSTAHHLLDEFES